MLCNWSETLLSQDPLITSLLRSHKESNLLVLDVSGGTVGSVVRNNPHALPVPRPNNTCRCRNPFQRLSFWGTATMEGMASSRLALSPPLGSSFLLSGFLNISIRRGWVSLPVLVTPHDTLNHASCRIQTFHRPAKRSVDYISTVRGAEPNLLAHRYRRGAKLLSHENVLDRRPSARSDHSLGWYRILAKLVFVVLLYTRQ